jgi:glutaredoxin
MATEITLYGRPGCHLCDDARDALLALAVELDLSVTEIDIERDDTLFKRYLERIPVVCVGGDEVCELFLDEAALRSRLDTVQRT